MSPLRIVEWSQALYADMPERCWTIVDSEGRDVAGTFWDHLEAQAAMRSMSTAEEVQRGEIDGAMTTVTRYVPDHHDFMEELRQRDEEAIRGADPTIRHPEGY